MTISRIQLSQFRNIEKANLCPNLKLNFVLGENGSGKSSFLESIFYIGHGKSFRSNNIENLLRHDATELVVSIKDNEDNSLGISRNSKGDVRLRVNAETKHKLSEIACYIAVQVITPESFKMFWGGPKERRKFVDFGLFHVKHDYGKQWQAFNKVLKQRNALLKLSKQGKRVDNLEYWTELFCKLSEELDQARAEYIGAFSKIFKTWLAMLLPELAEEIDIELFSGWSNSQSLSLYEVLQKNSAAETRYGFSAAGAHKFDLVCTAKELAIDQSLSRGQQKLFLIALMFAQSNMIGEISGRPAIVLVDDIGAELDIQARNKFANAINQLNAQLFITAIDASAIEPIASKVEDYAMFHVKHGVIEENNK